MFAIRSSTADDAGSHAPGFSLDEDEGMIPEGLFGLNFNTNICKPNVSYIWCLPSDYNQEKHPFTCRFSQHLKDNNLENEVKAGQVWVLLTILQQ